MPRYYGAFVLQKRFLLYCIAQVVVAVPAIVIPMLVQMVLALFLKLVMVSLVLTISTPGWAVVHTQLYCFLHDADRVATIISDKIICFIFSFLCLTILFTKLIRYTQVTIQRSNRLVIIGNQPACISYPIRVFYSNIWVGVIVIYVELYSEMFRYRIP